MALTEMNYVELSGMHSETVNVTGSGTETVTLPFTPSFVAVEYDFQNISGYQKVMYIWCSKYDSTESYRIMRQNNADAFTEYAASGSSNNVNFNGSTVEISKSDYYTNGHIYAIA